MKIIELNNFKSSTGTGLFESKEYLNNVFFFLINKVILYFF
jgi:hypothetical protein